MEIISERKKVTNVSYERYFEYAPHCGFGFPCDKDGNVLTDSANYECWRKNYEDCVAGKYPELTNTGVRKFSDTYTENAVGICDNCGEEVQLYNEYCGACECENCGAWYTVNGQSINPPDMWEEPIEADY